MAESDGHGGLCGSVSMVRLSDALRRAWSADTSSDPSNWSPSNPAWGQCAITALVVQDHFGGDLRRGTVGGVSHYWNVLPSGETVDLTLHQFGTGACQVAATTPRSREYVLAFPDTVDRYHRLRREVSALLDCAFREPVIAA
jgi:hypothetical protein